eukprot:1756736-Karenia_brevis.AAC.1
MNVYQVCNKIGRTFDTHTHTRHQYTQGLIINADDSPDLAVSEDEATSIVFDLLDNDDRVRRKAKRTLSDARFETLRLPNGLLRGSAVLLLCNLNGIEVSSAEWEAIVETVINESMAVEEVQGPTVPATSSLVPVAAEDTLAEASSEDTLVARTNVRLKTRSQYELMPQNELVDLVLQRDAVIRPLRDKCKTFGKRFGIADKKLAKYKAPDAIIKSDPSD